MIRIKTGEDIIKNSIKEFNVVNGYWHGTVTKDNDEYTLHIGNIVGIFGGTYKEEDAFVIKEDTKLELNISCVLFDTNGKSLDEKFNIFNFLYENGEDYEESLHRAGITEDDIGDKESFKVLADFNRSFAKLVEVFPEAKDKLDVLNIEADILSKIIGNEKDIER